MELKQFKITVVPLRDKLLNYARRMTDDPSDAEDAVQEVMLKLWNLRQKLDEYRSIEAVAMTMTHHLCMDMWRAKRPDTLSLDRVQAPTPSATPERLLEEKDEFRLMREIIDSLPTLQRTIIRLPPRRPAGPARPQEKRLSGHESPALAHRLRPYLRRPGRLAVLRTGGNAPAQTLRRLSDRRRSPRNLFKS